MNPVLGPKKYDIMGEEVRNIASQATLGKPPLPAKTERFAGKYWRQSVLLYEREPYNEANSAGKIAEQAISGSDGGYQVQPW